MEEREREKIKKRFKRVMLLLVASIIIANISIFFTPPQYIWIPPFIIVLITLLAMAWLPLIPKKELVATLLTIGLAMLVVVTGIGKIEPLFLLIYVLVMIIPLRGLLLEVPKRLRDLKKGARGFLFSPLCFGLGILIAIPSFLLAQILPILQWGWLGFSLATMGMEEDAISFIPFALVFLIACITINYYEEKIFRKNYKRVLLWALLHLLMGIPLFVVLPLIGIGVFLKCIYDKYSLQHAYATHFGHNLIVLSLAICVSFLP